MIKLNSIEGSKDINFLILDLEDNDRTGYYMGRLDTWFGFFWDGKRLYQKSIPLEHKDEIERLFVKYLENPLHIFRFYQKKRIMIYKKNMRKINL